MPINFEGDQDQFDQMPEEWKDHLMKAVVHKAGLGPHPGIYKGPTRPMNTGEPTEAELASERVQEQGPAPMMPEGGPLPPQESLEQPSPGQGKKKEPSAPHGTTPVALGQQAVQPEPPEGQF
jgi:hypothetical protein